MNQLVRGSCQAYLSRAKPIESLLNLSSRGTTSIIRQIQIRKASSDTDFKPSEELAKERYDSRANEDIERKRARLLYQSRKRGMLENGVILASFANKHLDKLDIEQLDQYDKLINLPTNDWDIFYWITKTKPTPPEFETPIMAKLREHVNCKVSNDTVLGKSRPDDIVFPVKKKSYDLDVDVSQVSMTDYDKELFDDRIKSWGNGKYIVLMTEWRKKFFRHRLRRAISSPTTLKTLSDTQKTEVYTQRAEKEVADHITIPKNLIDTPYEKTMKHHNLMQRLLGPELTNDALDYDDEVEAWSDMIWHRNYGRLDSKIAPSKTLKCASCRSRLHCCDPGLDGYVPREVFVSIGVDESVDAKQQQCQRCNFASTYGVRLSQEVSHDTYIELLRDLARKPPSVVCVLVDLTDLPGSIMEGLLNYIGQEHDVIVIGNKLDLLPKDGPKLLQRVGYAFKHNISRLLYGERHPKIADSMVLSARTGFGVEGLVARLLNLSESSKDIFLIGSRNTGKSTLFNALLQSDLCAIRKGDILTRVSPYTPHGVDLPILRFPIDIAEGWEIELKKRRTERVERNTARRERSLENLTKFRQETMPHISSLIDRLDYTPIGDATLVTNSKYGSSIGEEYAQPKFSADHPLRKPQQRSPLSATEKEFDHHKFFHLTPSVRTSDQLDNLLTNEERLEVFPNETIAPRKYSLRPMQSIFIAGLARLDLLTSQSNVIFTVFASKYLPIHVISTRKADQFYDTLLGSPYLGVPFGDNTRLAAWPGLRKSETDFLIKGVAQHVGAADIVFGSIGWILVNLIQDQECLVRALTPEGRGIFFRDPPLLSRASSQLIGKKIRDTPVFKNQHYVTESISELGSSTYRMLKCS